MARRDSETPFTTFEDRARQFLRAHRRIVSDFERSLKSARHFLKLAGRSLEQEPEATIQMLEQIREIDLLRHVTQQFEEYQSVVAMLPAAVTQGDPALPDEELPAEIKSMRARYERLVEDAEGQAGDMEKILSSLQTPH